MIAKKITKIIRNYFVAGMITIIPVWITVLAIMAIVNLVTDTFNLLPPALQPSTYFPYFGVELVIALFLIIIVGFIANNFFGKRIIKLGESILAKIPIVKTVYQSVKHLTTGIVSDKKIFSRVVLIEFPIKGILCIGFVTGEDTQLLGGREKRKMLKIFVPTTPNPTTGFFCLAPEEEVKPLHLSVDEAFKMIMSVGYSDLKIDL
jgi:uncharacterized membrane protein